MPLFMDQSSYYNPAFLGTFSGILMIPSTYSAWHKYSLGPPMFFIPLDPMVKVSCKTVVLVHWLICLSKYGTIQGRTKCRNAGPCSQAHLRKWQAHYPRNELCGASLKFICKIWHCSNGGIPRHKNIFCTPSAILSFIIYINIFFKWHLNR